MMDRDDDGGDHLTPVEALAEGQTAEELVCLVAEPAHAGAVEQVLGP